LKKSLCWGDEFFGNLFVSDLRIRDAAAAGKQQAAIYRRATDRSKIGLMAGCLTKTKRFRHGRPDRGRL